MEARYGDWDGPQLTKELLTLGSEYMEKMMNAAREVSMSDPSVFVEVPEVVNEEEWEGIEYFNTIKNGRRYRVAIPENLYPEVYSLRRKGDWLQERINAHLSGSVR